MIRRLSPKPEQANPDIFHSWNIWLPQPEHFGKHYLRIILWQSRGAMHRHKAADDGTTLFAGLHAPEQYLVNEKTHKRRFKTHISTIHLVKDEWTLEMVAHELLHFIFMLGKVTKTLSQIENGDMNGSEEPYCYLYGQLFDRLYHDLWDYNSYGLHKEIRNE